ncbi:MAG: hypothetical protein R3F37_09655 [Candidatus Competibacteraceae bacterium]
MDFAQGGGCTRRLGAFVQNSHHFVVRTSPMTTEETITRADAEPMAPASNRSVVNRPGVGL